MTIARFTTTQTIGPFFHEGLRWGIEASKAPSSTAATISISGIVFDGHGQPIVDALVECWSPGRETLEDEFATPGFRRAYTTDEGRYVMKITAPEQGTGDPAAYVTIFARGLLKHQFSAVFLEEDTGLAGSQILGQVPPERRTTLIAKKTGPAEYRWNIKLQGDDETVFFDFA